MSHGWKSLFSVVFERLGDNQNILNSTLQKQASSYANIQIRRKLEVQQAVNTFRADMQPILLIFLIFYLIRDLRSLQLCILFLYLIKLCSGWLNPPSQHCTLCSHWHLMANVWRLLGDALLLKLFSTVSRERQWKEQLLSSLFMFPPTASLHISTGLIGSWLQVRVNY